MRDSRRWRVLAVASVLAVALQLYGVYRVTGPPTPFWFPQADKLEHLVGFGLPTALVPLTAWARARALPPGAHAPHAVLVPVVVVFAVHAVVSELVQHAFYTTRSGDPRDVLADWTGIALGAGVALALRPRLARVGASRP